MTEIQDPQKQCEHPQDRIEMGFGLAGGGYGAYSYCSLCCTVLDKTQEPIDEEIEKDNHDAS